MASVTKLIRQRGSIKSQVTRIQTFVDSHPQLSPAEARVRLKKLEDHFNEFNEVQEFLEEATPEDAGHEPERQEFEDKYYALAAKLQERIDAVAAAAAALHPAMINPGQMGGVDNNQQMVFQERRNRTKLPDIKLPEFSGDFTKWLFFKNSFETTVHQDEDLTNMQKHQYLVGVLRGEARSAIEGFTISNENYEEAWTLLKDTYDNEVMIVETHMEELLNFPAITKDEKAESLRLLVWHIQTHISSLKTLHQPVDNWGGIIIHLVKKKLDYIEQRDWQDTLKGRTPQNMPTLKEFLAFLTERCHNLRMLQQSKQKTTKDKLTTQKNESRGEKNTGKKVALVSNTTNCRICGGSHFAYRCEELLKLSTNDRKQKVIEKHMCTNCFSFRHKAQECSASGCKRCGEKHNTLLHPENQSSGTPATQATFFCANTPAAGCSSSTFHVAKTASQVILSTALVDVNDASGNWVTCRALLDPGSQVNLITIELAQKLKLAGSRETRAISGVNCSQFEASKSVQLSIKARDSVFRAEIECLLLPSITEYLPQQKIDVERILIPRDTKLADPGFSEPGSVDLLIGAALYWKVLLGAPRNMIKGQPSLQNTRFGWIVGGEMSSPESLSSATCLTVTNSQLSHQLERFWKLETLPEKIFLTKEEKACERHFVETVTRDGDGRFTVRLPLRPTVELGKSRTQTQNRFESLERRLKRQPALKQAYQEFLNEYLDTGHMSLITDPDSLKHQEVCYIPHQVIVKPDSLSTKTRVVFDASQKTSLGTSLNDKLMPGPNLQKDLFTIVLKFRLHEYVITADITKMFRQIFIDPRDRKYQLILWRQQPEQPIEVYQLNTVTYGTASAPYHAMRCLRELAIQHRDVYPLAASAVENDFYMDDVLTGTFTKPQAIKLQRELSELLMRGQFPLRKWRSNDPDILRHLSQQTEVDPLLTLDKEEAQKTLGLFWNSANDQLQYQVTLPEKSAHTKRVVLSQMSQIFDPLGIVGPVLIRGKIFMQQLWPEGVEWDQPLSDELIGAWGSYHQSLLELNTLRIPRNVTPGNASPIFDVAGFGDASELAYGACLYAVSRDRRGEAHSLLLCSKSRVAPLKKISLPRLELEAALLLSQLLSSVKAAFGERIDQVRLWSDSTVTLGWIKAESQRFKTYVANRITKIQELTEGATWHHVPTAENPADLLSRGTTVDNLKSCALWWHGPSWLVEDIQQPQHAEPPERDLPEERKSSVSLVVVSTPAYLLTRYSSFAKLCRVVGYVHRFVSNARSSSKTGPLDPSELSRAEKTVLNWVQTEAFPQELRCLQNHQELSKKSPLVSLKPFLDTDRLIRVGGRLEHAELPHSQKHPIVLPAKHHVTSLIMRDKHEQAQHCPPEQLLHLVRERFWPISGRREAQKVLRQCLQCFRYRPAMPTVVMGDLPPLRVKAFVRPFTTTGVDYAGPLQLRESRRRGRVHVSKAYVAVFTCFSTKAIHLELVSDLTTEAFLAALSRFTARRGLCSQIFSDNGTNFVGASRQLDEVYAFLEKEECVIATSLASQRVTWNFIPPRAPHFGGLWEAAVKSMKRHLYTVTQGKVLTFEEYSTLLANIEAVLNSRPLTPLTNNPNDFTVLTPSHFLVGDSLLQPPQYNVLNVADNRLSRWQHLQKLRQQLWLRWQREYLQELQKRAKWHLPGAPIELDMLVLLIEDNVSPLQWALGRIIEVHPGPDGHVRVVTVKTQGGVFKRAVKKLCPLPMDPPED